jgi:undecaprenyl-diphosphatase
MLFQALAQLDALARSGALWFVTAFALWGRGKRSTRRAALRGLLNAAISWAIATAFGRHLDADARASAAATAFATGAALESRSAGAAAAALGIRSVGRGLRANPAGVLTGAGVTLASSRVWPVPPSDGPQAPPVRLPNRAEPSVQGHGLFVAVNKASGNGNGSGPGPVLEQELPAATVEDVEIVHGDELRKVLDEAAEDAVVLGVAGGDGSINTAAQIALDHHKPLALFPAGTFNHLAGALAIEGDGATIEALARGQAVGIDAATIDGHVFVNTASFGAYVELVDMRQKLEKRFGKWPAVVIALVRVLRHSEPVAVEIDGRPTKVWMAFIGNCRYSPSGFAPSWRERLDDEQIDFRYVDGSAPFARSRLVLAVLTGRLASCKVYEQLVVKELTIRSLQGPLRLARDGETFVSSSDEIVVRKLPERLAVYCPHENVG